MASRPKALIAAAVLLMRVAWTAGELLVGGALYVTHRLPKSSETSEVWADSLSRKRHI